MERVGNIGDASNRPNGRDRELGFTLIELLIVIVVLGILAAVVVFALGSVTSKSAKSACAADAKTVETAIGVYEANGNTITPTSTILMSTANGGPYLRSWPSNGTHYVIGIGQMPTTTVGYSADEVDIAPNVGTAPAAASSSWVKFDTEASGGCQAVN